MKQGSKPIQREIELGDRRIAYQLFLGSYKNINLRIKKDGSVRVSANRLVPMARIEEFLRSNRSFIEGALRRFEEAEVSPVMECPWKDGGIIPLLGEDRRIEVIRGKKNFAVLREGRIDVTARNGSAEEIRGAVRALMERELSRVTEELSSVLEPRLESRRIPAHQYRFRSMVSRWGSCCPSKRTVTLNRYLICAPIECIEYVIVHEAAHFLELNHSGAFWSIVAEMIPDWKERKKRLIPYGAWLRIL